MFPSPFSMTRTIDEIIAGLREKPIERSFVIERDAAVDEESRTVNLAFATDTPIEHWFGTLALSMTSKAMRSERLKGGMALLMDHNSRDQVGVVENFSLDKGVARADVRFDTDQRSTDIFNSVKNGVRRNVSVGFMVHEMHLESEKKGEKPVYRSDDWEPYEISIVAIPADTKAGVGREFEPPKNPTIPEPPSPESRAFSTETEKTMSDKTDNTPVTPAVERTAEEITRDRENAIVEWAGIFGDEGTEIARGLLATRSDVTQDDVRMAIKAKRDAAPQIIVPPQNPQDIARANGVELARTLPRHGELRNFRGDGAAERAYRFGQFLMASVLGNTKARDFCSTNGIALNRAMGESVNETGGYLVPDEFGNDLIDLREQFGVFRRNAKIVPMASDTRSDPRRTGGLTAYFVAEAGAITASDMGWDRVELVAKKLAVLARYSSEINEDSSIAFGDTLAGEIAYAFAEKEDRCGFLGDATDTYGGITGVCQKLLGLSSTRADIAGAVVGTGNLFSELVIGDFEAVVAKLPQYADTDAAAWYVHRGFYWNVMVKAMLASGGVTAAEIEDARKQRFMGYRVEFTQVMPNVDANDQVVALFGDLAKAASMGIRRDTQIALSEHSRFANDQIEIRGTERFDINVHDVGNSSATAASRVPGPIVGLLSAAS